MHGGMSGGCLCGAVRYRSASEPFDAGWCHCRICQLNSGTAAMAFACVKANDWIVEEGAAAIRTFASSDKGRRTFCSRCGTPLLMTLADDPVVAFSLGTLDHPDAIAPGFHIYWSSRVAWFNPDDDLPRYSRGRP